MMECFSKLAQNTSNKFVTKTFQNSQIWSHCFQPFYVGNNCLSPKDILSVFISYFNLYYFPLVGTTNYLF